MSKETFYFSHDYNARSDLKLTCIKMKHGMAGIGIFWCLIEMLYEQDGYMPLQYDGIAFELRTDTNVIQSIICECGLFKYDKERFWSESVLRRLEARNEKSEKARESVNKRWGKYERNTNVIRTQNDCNTIKESKVKDIKENIFLSEKINFEFEKFLKNEDFNKRPVSDERQKALIDKLNSIAPNDDDYQVAVIRQAVAGNYSDFRPIADYKKTDSGKPQAPSPEEFKGFFVENGESEETAQKVYDHFAYNRRWKDPSGFSIMENWKQYCTRYFNGKLKLESTD